MDCKHEPIKLVSRFDDAWMGSYRTGHYESGYNYEPIVCRHCGIKIRANTDLTKWEENA